MRNAITDTYGHANRNTAVYSYTEAEAIATSAPKSVVAIVVLMVRGEQVINQSRKFSRCVRRRFQVGPRSLSESWRGSHVNPKAFGARVDATHAQTA